MNIKKKSLGKKLILSLLLLSISGQTFTMDNRLIKLVRAMFIAAIPLCLMAMPTYLLSNYRLHSLPSNAPHTPAQNTDNADSRSDKTGNGPASHQQKGIASDQNKFFEAIAQNDVEQVKKLIPNNKINVNELITQISHAGEITQISALQICAQKKQLELMRVLIEDGKANVNINTGCAPLHICAAKGFFEGAELLLQNKANVNILTDPTKNTPLHVCRDEKIAQLLINNKADMSAVNHWQETPEQSGDVSENVRRIITANNFSKPVEKNYRNKQTVITQKMPERWQQELLLKNSPEKILRSKL